ncbi:MAG: WbqC family protein [Sulfurospirillaceae bacterium]|nr:WbqC family protein [Sulfurospirillaceae bacterium]MCK9546151.1 WbqC family protein [Sulfurospirillaceae bacterium]
MQPYFFPYIGYWQLINSVDAFLIYDDVNFVNRSYITRNSILSNGKAQLITLELLGASQNKLINETKIGNNKARLLKTIQFNYKKSPYFNETIILLEDILNHEEKNLAKFLGYQIEKICEHLEIDTKILYSSNIQKNNKLRGQDKVIDSCKNLQSKKYINSIGGKELYSKEIFEKNGIKLEFLQYSIDEYPQFNNTFIGSLSIIDVLMFNDKEKIKNMLLKYELI